MPRGRSENVTMGGPLVIVLGLMATAVRPYRRDVERASPDHARSEAGALRESERVPSPELPAPSSKSRRGSSTLRRLMSQRSLMHHRPTRTRRPVIWKLFSSSVHKWKSVFQRARIEKVGRRPSISDWAASGLFFRSGARTRVPFLSRPLTRWFLNSIRAFANWIGRSNVPVACFRAASEPRLASRTYTPLDK